MFLAPRFTDERPGAKLDSVDQSGCAALASGLHHSPRRNRHVSGYYGHLSGHHRAAVGLLFLRLHTLPERMAHSSQKLQFEIVAVLGLLALFTHIHLFWVAGLILALIDIPDWGTPLRRIAASVEKIAGLPPGEDAGGPDTRANATDHQES